MYKKKENLLNVRKSLLKDLFSHVKNDNINLLASQTTFGLIVALVPFLVVTINLILFVASSQIVLIQEYIKDLPKDLYTLVNELINFVLTKKSTGILSFGIITTIWSASKGVKALLNSLNTAFDNENNNGFIYTQIKSILITVLLIITIMVMLGGVVFGDFIVSAITSFFKITLNTFTRSLITFLRILIPFILMILVFTSIFFIGPNFDNRKLPPFKPCLIGGIISTIGCSVITFAYSFYINNIANMSSVYGPLVGIMILFLWLNYTITIIIFSGEVSASCLRVLYEKKESISKDNNTNLDNDNKIEIIDILENTDENKKDTF